MEATWWTKPEDLDNDQRAVVALDKDGDHLVCGPPGCGKTNLLLLRAGYMHTIKRRNFVVLTYGRVLREFLATGAMHYPFDSDRITTYAAWAIQMSAQSGLSVPQGVDEPTARAHLLKNLQEIVNKGGFTPFDCLLVDEVQDYDPAELDAIQSLCKQVFFVGDSRQEIYGARNAIDHLKIKIDSCKELSAHYRNGLKICRVADSIFDECDHPNGMEATSQYNETAYPSSVLPFSGMALSTQAAKAIDEIITQLVAYPTGFIGVMCPRHLDLDVVLNVFNNSALADHFQIQRSSDGYSALDSGRRVILTTLHGAKGLEFRAVHFLAADRVTCFKAQTRRVAYTAITRAKTYLAVYSERALPGFLDKAVTIADEAPVIEPTLAELFAKV